MPLNYVVECNFAFPKQEANLNFETRLAKYDNFCISFKKKIKKFHVFLITIN